MKQAKKGAKKAAKRAYTKHLTKSEWAAMLERRVKTRRRNAKKRGGTY